MKTKISRIGKKSLSVIIALMMIVSTMLVGMVSVSAATFTSGTKIYLDVTKKNDWASSGYIYMYMYGTGDASWAKMTKVTGETYIYEGTVPDGTDDSNIIFLRNTEDKADWKQDRQTIDIYSYDGVKNMYVLSATDSDKKFGETYKQQGDWDTYSGSSTSEYTVSKGTATNGTFTVSPESAAEGATVTVTTSPSSGFEVYKVTYTYGTTTANATGSGNSYTFQMPAANVTVNVTFKQTSTSTGKTVYFKNTAGWTTVMCYAWDNNDTATDGAWHGKAMTKVDGTDDVYTVTLSSNAVNCLFNDNNNTKTGDLTIQEGKIFIYDTSYTTDKGHWEDYGSTPSGNYKLADKSGNYGKVVFTVGGKVVTSANENDEVTATVTPNTGFEYVADSFSVTNDTSKEAVGTPTGTTLTFTMPASDVTATAKFALNKAEYVKTLEDGLYVDVAPDKNDTTATFVMWNNYTGVGQDAPSSGYAAHNTKDYHTLYIPANVDLGSVTLYNAFSSEVKINGQTVPADGSNTVSLTEKTYNADSNNTYKVQVLKGSTSSMFLYTNDGKGNDYDLPTSKKNYTGLLDKETVKASGGLCTTIKGSTVSDALDLSQVKGRGNSSWEASATLFGKYAFNMKLSSPTSLFDLPKSKSFCLLANNMDDALMRNAYVYQLARDIGLYDSPEFEFVDIYDNGEYMGAYLITEKVDVADKNKLIKGNSIDDLNEKAGAKFDEDHPVHTDDLGYATIKSGPNLDNDTNFVKKYQTTGTYLLEFEIPERVKNEPSYFKSSQGQNVVLKSPEFATQGEVEFIKEKFNAMEALVYASTIDLEALSKVMDLDSFARMYLIQEFTSNLDSAATSYYITYDCSKGLFVASPVWDYDWALGQNSGTKKAKDDSLLYANNAEAWFAKYKAMGDGTQSGSYSLQSKLATDSNFQTVIKKVWFGKNNDGFYNKVQAYYTDGGQLDTWKNQISKSVSMNEERWGFIANNPARSSWGSPDTTGGNGFTGAVNFLKTTWSSKRGTWLNNEFNKYSNYSQIATPTLTAYAADETTPLEGEVTAGDTYVLKADTSEIYVDYVLYDGSTEVETNTNGVFTINNATSGTHSYTVKTVYSSTDMKTSSAVDVTVATAVEIDSVTISSSKTAVNVNEVFTLTATASPSDLTGVKYTFYKDGVAISDATDITSNTYKTKITAEGSAVYTVSATLNGKTVNSATPVTVTAEIAPIDKEVTIYFKSSSASAYVPSLSVDGSAPAVMTRNKQGEANSTYFGSTYSGSLKFYWFYTTMTIDASKEHTLTFTTKDNRVNAKMSYTFSAAEDNKYYFAVNNLMGDTELVDLTDKAEYIRNYHISATHMVHSTTYDNTVGFTWINGKEYAMGTNLQDNNISTASLSDLTSSSLLTIPSALNPNAMLQAASTEFFTIKSATLAQKITAEAEEVSTLQYQLLDVNLDGKVDIKDSTMMQKALAGF
ncbi:CotH kinase family protein [uncultured Ruminococcus sp.]|uniref:CotH kinase family protein n=1 Tax=uncultured Ruminococcus sp. TaxID=165186 RepID=UPI0025E5909F|nr:CotH kinase family protein [uncultured Ruminococcus sp.]